MTAQAAFTISADPDRGVSCVQALLAVVPGLLGFTPQSSIVVLGLQGPRGQVKLTIRYDLPDPDGGEGAAAIAEHALTIFGEQRLDGAIAVGYGPDALVRPVAAAFRDQARDREVELRDFVRAEHGRYWSYACTKESCGPAAGTPYDVSAVAPAELAPGGKVLASRDAVAASIAPLSGTTAGSMREATRRAEQQVTRLLARVRRSGTARQALAAEGLAAAADMISAYRDGRRFRDLHQVAWLTVALKDLRIRDEAWARMDPRHAGAHLRMWTDIVRRAQPGYVAGPASLLAFVAWQQGNGVLANVALDRALADNPGYSMALLLRQVISAGAPPSMAKVPMSPGEVAAAYDEDGDPGDEGEAGADEQEPDGQES